MRKRGIASGISPAQERAIGRMTIQFNLMEHALELLIDFILGTDGSGLTSPLIRRMHFGTKVDVLKEQVGALGEQSAPTAETQEAYQRFTSEVKNLISQAKQLNTFRNSVIHWRPFLAGSAPRPESEVSAETICEKAKEMQRVSIELLSHAIGVRQGDNALTFGRQFKTGESKNIVLSTMKGR